MQAEFQSITLATRQDRKKTWLQVATLPKEKLLSIAGKSIDSALARIGKPGASHRVELELLAAICCLSRAVDPRDRRRRSLVAAGRLLEASRFDVVGAIAAAAGLE